MKRIVWSSAAALLLAGCVAEGGQSITGDAEGGKISVPITVNQNSGPEVGQLCYHRGSGRPMCQMYQPGYVGASCSCNMGYYGWVPGVIGR